MKLRIVILTVLFLCFAPICEAASTHSIAAVVNGEMITAYDMQIRVNAELKRLGLDPKNPDQSEQISHLRKALLESMINTIILTQEAERLKITASTTDIDEEIQQLMERGHLTQEEFQRQLQLQGQTEASLREKVRTSVLRKRLLAAMVGRKVVVTKSEIADYYDQHQGMFKHQQVGFSVLVYPPDANAEKISVDLKRNPASFEKTVQKISVGPRASQGGNLGMTDWQDLDTAWKNALMPLRPGGVSNLFEVNGLKTQVKMNEISSGENQSLEEATPKIEALLREPKLQQRFEEYTEQLRKRAMIDIRQ